MWFGYSAGAAPLNATVAYGVTNAAGEVVRRDDFEAPYSSMVHDFLVTRRHVLFPILPLTGSLERAMRGGPAFAWEPDKGAFVGVMARDAGVETIRWFETEACYVFHPMNAWEEGRKIFADVMEYPSAPLFPNADGSPQATLRRAWSAGRSIWPESRTPSSANRSTTWPANFRGSTSAARASPIVTAGSRPTRNARASCNSTPSPTSTSPAGKRATYELPSGDATGEPVFVPRSPSAGEGDGWLLAVVYRGETDRSDFVVFDAQDIAAGPIATAHVPRRVPFGFHGNWRPL